MKTPRTTFALIGLFFAGLIVLWWLDYAGVPTERERLARLSRILPDLIDTPEASIGRVEIARGPDRLVFERRGTNRWQMTRPIDVAADPAPLETLVRNLKDLRRSPDSGTITGPAGTFGLAPPEATIRVWSGEGSSGGTDHPPLAALEVGKTVRGSRYVRPSGSEGIEVVDPKLLGALDRPLKDWREYSLMPVPTFQVSRLRVRRDHLDQVAERGAGGRWRLSSPVSVPANGARIESTLAALASIRVLDDGKGFIADNVTDFKPFGLEEPAATVELTTTAAAGEPLVLHVGKPVPDHLDRVYVRRGDQDDVAAVDGKFLAEIPRDSIAYRSQHVADIEPAAVTKIRIEALKATFDLAREDTGWALKSPKPTRADTYLVQSFLSQVDGLQTSEFLDPARVITPMLDPPAMVIKIWQTSRGGREAAKKSGDPSQSPSLILRLGRHDVLKKTIYGRLEGDDVILALSDAFLEVLPKNLLAFRDRGILSLNPGTVSRLMLERDGKTTILEPDRSSQAPNQWRMKAPVVAPADVRAVTQALALLANLRAEDFAADSAGDGKAFGLDRPAVVATWVVEGPQHQVSTHTAPKASPGPGPSRGRLAIGKAVPGKPGSFYASVEGSPFVFTLGAAAVQALGAEFHDTQLMAFPPGSIRTLTLRLPGRAFSFVRSPQPRGGPADWSPLPGTDVRGLDLSRFDDLLNQMAQLRTTRFYQYGGPIPPCTGLLDPRLVIELGTGDGKPAHVLRVGESLRDGLAFAATGTGVSGPVFYLPAPAWDALIQSATPAGELPDNVFSPVDSMPR
jgi:hypothetical protein